MNGETADIWRTFRGRLPDWIDLTRLNRPVGIYLLLWPTLWALWIAGAGAPEPRLVVIFVLGVILTRAAGCVINDYADRHLDGHVRRTAGRPLPEGRVSEREALALCAALTLAAFVLVLLTNALTIALSGLAVALAALYPFTKRFTHLPQIFLGAAFSCAIPMAFAAQTGAVPGYAWLLFAANVLWTVAYDTEYAMVDRPWDLEIGIKSSAILFGRLDRLIVWLLQLAFLACLAALGVRLAFGAAYALGLVGAAGVFVWQQYAIRERDVDACFTAFRSNHYAGMAVFAGLAAELTLGL